MAYLRNINSSVITLDLVDQGVEYESLAALRDPTTKVPLWEEVPEDIAASSTSRAAVIVNSAGAAVGADETVSMRSDVGRPGTVTDARYFAFAAVTGAGTNSRTLTIVQGSAQGAGTPARTTIATLALLAGVNLAAYQASPAFTINSGAIIADAPLELVSTHVGTGIADPGGFAVVTFTAA